MMVFEECYTISRYGQGLGSLKEIRTLPTYERRALLHKLAEDAKRAKEERDKAVTKTNNKKGR